MSAPIPQTTFDQRLPLVRAEVMARIETLPAQEQNYQRARLWCAWIRRNVLDVPSVPAPRASRAKINCDLYGGAV